MLHTNNDCMLSQFIHIQFNIHRQIIEELSMNNLSLTVTTHDRDIILNIDKEHRRAKVK